MNVAIGDVVPARVVASAANCSKRTIARAAKRQGVIVYLGGVGYIRRGDIERVVGEDRMNDLLRLLQNPGDREAVGDLVNTENLVSRKEAADATGCSITTVWRVAKRFNIGVRCYGNILLTREMLPAVKDKIGKYTATKEEISAARRRAVNVRWSRARASRSGTSGTGAGDFPSNPCRAASR